MHTYIYIEYFSKVRIKRIIYIVNYVSMRKMSDLIELFLISKYLEKKSLYRTM